MIKANILYVDDEEINLEIFKMSMSRYYIVHLADSGKKALDILGTHKDISIVISDMNMPHMSGLEFIKAASIEYPQLKFFMLSGYEITGEVEENIQNGLIIKYYRKPFKLLDIHKDFQEILK